MPPDFAPIATTSPSHADGGLSVGRSIVRVDRLAVEARPCGACVIEVLAPDVGLRARRVVSRTAADGGAVSACSGCHGSRGSLVTTSGHRPLRCACPVAFTRQQLRPRPAAPPLVPCSQNPLSSPAALPGLRERICAGEGSPHLCAWHGSLRGRLRPRCTGQGFPCPRCASLAAICPHRVRPRLRLGWAERGEDSRRPLGSPTSLTPQPPRDPRHPEHPP